MYFKTKFLQRKFKSKLHPKSQAPLNFVRQSTIRLLTYYHVKCTLRLNSYKENSKVNYTPNPKPPLTLYNNQPLDC